MQPRLSLAMSGDPIYSGKLHQQGQHFVVVAENGVVCQIEEGTFGLERKDFQPGIRVVFRIHPHTHKVFALLHNTGDPAKKSLLRFEVSTQTNLIQNGGSNQLTNSDAADVSDDTLDDITHLDDADEANMASEFADSDTAARSIEDSDLAQSLLSDHKIYGVVQKIFRRGDGAPKGSQVFAASTRQVYFIPPPSLRKLTNIEPGLRVIIRPYLKNDSWQQHPYASLVGIDYESTLDLDTAIRKRIRNCTNQNQLLEAQRAVARWEPGFLHTSVVHDFIKYYEKNLPKGRSNEWSTWVESIEEFAHKCRNRGKSRTLPRIRRLLASALWYGYFCSDDVSYLHRIIDQCEDKFLTRVAALAIEDNDYRQIVTVLGDPDSGIGNPVELFAQTFSGTLSTHHRDSAKESAFLDAIFQANGNQDVPFSISLDHSLHVDEEAHHGLPLLRIIFTGSRIGPTDLNSIRSKTRKRRENAFFISDLHTGNFQQTWTQALLEHLRKTHGINVLSPVYGQAFFGRKKIIRDVIDSEHQGAFFLTGLRKVGKTSLALKLLDELRIDRGYQLRLGAPLPAGPLYTEPRIPLQFQRVKPYAQETHDSFAEVVSIFQQPHVNANNTGLFVDEIGLLFRRRTEEHRGRSRLVVDPSLAPHILGLLVWLREIIDAKKAFLLAASPTPDIVFEQSFYDHGGVRYDNPLFGLFETKYVVGIDEDETAEMIQHFTRKHFVVCRGDVFGQIHRLSGGIPIVSRLILNLLIEGVDRPQYLTDEDVSQADWRSFRERDEWKQIEANLLGRLHEIADMTGGFDVARFVTAVSSENSENGVPMEILARSVFPQERGNGLLKTLEDYGYLARTESGFALKCKILEKMSYGTH